MNLEDYGPVPNTNDLPGIPARVTAVHRDRFELICHRGMTFGRLKTGAYFDGNESFPTTGDYVMIRYIPNGDSLILSTLPRRTLFSRREPGPVHREQAVAANFDYVFILQSLNQDLNLRRLERYLTMGWQSGATPVVLLTKADLVADPRETLAAVERVAMGADVHVISACRGDGLEELKRYLLPGNTLVFLGSSGVGKSSLVNALAGREVMAVGGIREQDGKGRHTTTHRQLLRLDSGVLIIDTPGMRELGMWNTADGIVDAFSDVEAYLGKCRFSDCRHDREPGCAIRQAIAAGELDEKRWENYRKLKTESEDREDLRRRKQEWSKGVAKVTRQQRKEIR